MSELRLDPYTWFTERELKFKPKHFIVTRTPVTSESKRWIFDKLQGRFALVSLEPSSRDTFDELLSTLEEYPAFEDPAEATFYELTWS